MELIDTTHNLISYAYSQKNKISKIVINSLLIFVVFAVFGCFDFVNFSIDVTLILKWKYWTTVITKTVGGSIMFNIGINLLFDKEIEKDEELKKQSEKYARLNDKKTQATFNYYVEEVFNREQKKKAYKSYINRKIYWLNKFARNKDKLLYSQSIKDGVKDYEQKVQELKKLKENNKYCVRRKEYELLKSDEYIEKNIDSITINYKRVDPIIFELELDGKGTYHGIKVKGNVNAGRARLTSSIAAGMVIVSMFMTSILLDPNQEQFADQMLSFWHYLMVCCEDIGILTWQLFRGTINARRLVSQEMTEPLVGRNIVLDSYYAWVIDNDVAPKKGEQIAKILGEGKNEI